MEAGFAIINQGDVGFDQKWNIQCYNKSVNPFTLSYIQYDKEKCHNTKDLNFGTDIQYFGQVSNSTTECFKSHEKQHFYQWPMSGFLNNQEKH